MAKKTAKKKSTRKKKTDSEKEAILRERRLRNSERMRRVRAEKRRGEIESGERDPSTDYDRYETIGRTSPTATHAEVAAILGMTTEAWNIKKESDPQIDIALKRGRLTTSRMVFGKIIEKVSAGDTRMIIHASKHLLDWRDHVEHTGSGGGPIRKETRGTGGGRGLSQEDVIDLKANLFGVRVDPRPDPSRKVDTEETG